MSHIKSNIINSFKTIYDESPKVFFSPGRVNLIGEHTDYNNGFVMPFAINKGTYIAISKRGDNIVNIYSENLDESTSFNLKEISQKFSNTWENYIKGTLNIIQNDFLKDISGANIYIFSDLPFGAGLSSSASLTTALAFAYNTIYELNIDKLDLAQTAQKVEHQYIGTNCGLMDQIACIFSQQDAATMIDCDNNKYTNIPFNLTDISLLIADTNIKHNLAESAYNQRRKVCENISKFNDIKSLRELTKARLDKTKNHFSEEDYNLALHVFTENERVLKASNAMQTNDWKMLGNLMYQSHESLKKYYRVSSNELDFLVKLSKNYSNVFGARMTGGGFGGSTIHLISNTILDDYKDHLEKQYSKEFGIKPIFYISKACQGAHEL